MSLSPPRIGCALTHRVKAGDGRPERAASKSSRPRPRTRPASVRPPPP